MVKSDAPMRVLVAKPGLDGHDRGAKILVKLLRDAGMEAIYTGRHQTPEAIVQAAVQEDVDVIGLSILSGSHMALTKKVCEALEAAGAGTIPVLVGGTIPKKDVEKLKSIGAAEVFPTGRPFDEAIDLIRTLGRE